MRWECHLVRALFLLSSCLCTEKLPNFQVPSFTLRELQSPLPPNLQHAFKDALTTHGIVAVSGVPSLAQTRSLAFEGYASCVDNGRLPTNSYVQSIYLQDGSRRFTVEASGKNGLPDVLRSHCGDKTARYMSRLRADVHQTNRLFAQRLSEAFGGAMVPNGHESALEHLLEEGNNLDHFHTYTGNTSTSTDQDAMALELHEDMGLYVAFVPALTKELDGPLMSDDGFLIEIEGKGPHRTRFGSADSVAFMFGAGVSNWFRAIPGRQLPRAAPHSLKLPATSDSIRSPLTFTRVWFGSMRVHPSEAPVLSGPDNSSLPYSKVLESINNFGFISAGCGTKRRAYAESGECSTGTNFCWMKCSPEPAQSCNSRAGELLMCVDPSVSGSTEQQSDACASGGVLGNAMNPNCKNLCVVPSHTEVELGYCQGGTDMYMSGFTWPEAGLASSQCVILLFEAWTLDSEFKFGLGCFGTICLGILLEALIYLRRGLTRYLSIDTPIHNMYYSIKVETCLGLFYGMQLTVGYFLMLVVMTYSTPLFICAIAGIVMGHVLFAVMDARQARTRILDAEDGFRDSTAQQLVAEGPTPCCFHELNSPNSPKTFE